MVELAGQFLGPFFLSELNLVQRFIYLYNKTRHLLPIAGRIAGPIGLTFFVDTHGWPRGITG